MNRISQRLSLLAVVAAVGCTQSPRVDVSGEQTALLQLDREWENAAAANQDFERIVSYWSDDAVVIPPGQAPVVGGEALLQMVRSLAQIPGFAVSWESTDVHLSPDGRMAYMRGTNKFTLPDSTGRLVTTEGRAVTVWQKNEKGEWKCVLDMWNNATAGMGGG